MPLGPVEYAINAQDYPDSLLKAVRHLGARFWALTEKRTGGRGPQELALVVRAPEAVRSVLRRIVAEEAAIECSSDTRRVAGSLL